MRGGGARRSGLPGQGLEFQLCAWFVNPRGFALVLSTGQMMKNENVLLAVPTVHDMVDRARILHSHGARHVSQIATLPSLVKHPNTSPSPAVRTNLRFDLFDPGHTYKYAAPGPLRLNGEPAGDYALWVPTNSPDLKSDFGRFYSKPADSPVRWAIWSLGPRPKSLRSQSSHAPVSELTWYRRTGGDGVIVRFANRDGVQFKSP